MMPKAKQPPKQSEEEIVTEPETGPDTGPETGVGTRADRKNDRRCIASGASLAAADPAIRFVLGPDGTIVPDLAEKLPGRGAWVSAERSQVIRAFEKGLFSRAFRQKAPGGADLAGMMADRLEAALAERCLNALGLARRAGHLVTGFEKTRSAVQKGTAKAYIHASDAASDGVSRILQAARAPLRVWHPFSGSELDGALGESNVVHSVITDHGMARRFGREATRYVAFTGADRAQSGSEP